MFVTAPVKWKVLFLIFTLLATFASLTRASENDKNHLMVPISPYTFLATVCEGVATRVSCQNADQVMYIEDAFFGRANTKTCSGLFSKTQNTECKSETAFKKIWKRCNKKNRCTIQATTRFYGQPCPGTDKYVQIHFRCAIPGRDVIGSCEPSDWGKWLDVDHPFGTGDSETLESHRATDKDLCASPIGMQIRTTDDINFIEQNQLLRHSLSYGMQCLNVDQADGNCLNYKVRYCCMKEEDCPVLDSPTNGLITNMPSNKYGGVYEFDCLPGYMITGPERLTCQPTGDWDNQVPSCVIDTSVCGGTIISSEDKFIGSPNYPYLYPNRKDCSWQIIAPPDKFIEVTFEDVSIQAHPRCKNDYVEIHNGTLGSTKDVKKLCGMWSKRVYKSSENIMTINFHSDNSEGGKGFTMKWKEIKGLSDMPKTCYASGRSHFSTFDGEQYRFTQPCSYVLARSKPGADINTPFIVEVALERRTRDESDSSWIGNVVIRLQRIIITMDKGKTLMINEELVSLPYKNTETNTSVEYSGRFLRLTTPDGLVVQYDGVYSFTVTLPAVLMGSVEGLCGDFDGNAVNDLNLLGTNVSMKADPNIFAEQFKTTTVKQCETVMADTSTVSTCTSGERNEYEDSCSIVMRKDGCFAKCHSTISPDYFYQSCVNDACSHKDTRTALIANIGLYVRMCQEAAIEVCGFWRNETDTVPRCGAHTHYAACANPCQPQCGDTDGIRKCSINVCVESCVCDEGYTRSGDQCVPKDECGCSRGGKYYKDNSNFLMNDCKLRCLCQKGRFSCKPAMGCEDGEKCTKSIEGKLSCAPTGSAKCVAWGDPHYKTLDGSAIHDFQGFCTYTMIYTHDLDEKNPKWLRIEARNEERHGLTEVSYLNKAIVHLKGGDVVVEMMHDQLVKVSSYYELRDNELNGVSLN